MSAVKMSENALPNFDVLLKYLKPWDQAQVPISNPVCQWLKSVFNQQLCKDDTNWARKRKVKNTMGYNKCHPSLKIMAALAHGLSLKF